MPQTVSEEEYLAHYGVKGMQWGVRKAYKKLKARNLARIKKREAKKKKILTDSKYAKKIVKVDMVKSAILSASLAIGVTKFSGGSWGDAARLAAGSAAVSSVMSAGLNGLGYAALKFDEK